MPGGHSPKEDQGGGYWLDGRQRKQKTTAVCCASTPDGGIKAFYSLSGGSSIYPSFVL